MSIETWLAFAAASAVMLAIPGPTILLVITYSLSHGRRVALASVSGVALGDFTAMTASMLGVGALLAASATLFTVLKWIGAAYLIWLGIKLWRTQAADDAATAAAPGTSPARIFAHMWLVTALNPKGIVFFVAFLPQFLDRAAPILPQMLIFGATFLTLAIVNAAAYALLASAARGAVRRPGVRCAIDRTGGTLLIGAGLMAALSRRAA